MTPEKKLAKEYAETINTPVNGWGQHVHPKLGLSSTGIMSRLINMVGFDESQRLIKQAMSPNPKEIE